MVQGEDFATGLQDASLGSLRDAKSSQGKLGDLKKTRVVGDSANNNQSLTLLGVLDKARKADGRAVDTRHEKALQNDFVEVGVSATSQEAVKLYINEEGQKLNSVLPNIITERSNSPSHLHQQSLINVLRLWCGPIRILHVVMLEVNTLSQKTFQSNAVLAQMKIISKKKRL